jgi:hypothetical protein
LVTDPLINRIINYLNSDITHIGLGTGAEPTVSSTTLDLEAVRKTTTKLIDQNTLIFEGYWDESEANGTTYTNTGVFGNGATNTLGSGELFAGGGINVPKDNKQSLTVSVEIVVEAVN